MLKRRDILRWGSLAGLGLLASGGHYVAAETTPKETTPELASQFRFVALDFVNNYLNIEKSGNYLISLLMAIILATIIAFHPQTFGKKEDIKGIEEPKTKIFYAMIGSLVGYTVNVYGSELGFIFFGLGGLMRFRSNMSNSTQTGRLILVTLIGLSCGLKMIYIAILSTIISWILIYFLERKTIYQLEIKRINSEQFLELIESYRYILKQENCTIIREKKNQVKSKIIFILSSTSKFDPDRLNNLLNKNVVKSNRISINCTTVDE